MGVLLYPDISNFTFRNVKNIKCKIYLIDFLNELGNFKQNKFYTSKCKFFLHFTTTDPFPPPFRPLLSLIEKISKEFEKIGRTILIYYITPYINTLGIPSVDCRILLRKQKYESRVFSTSFD